MNVIEKYNQFKVALEKIYDSREADNISDWVFENVTGLKKWQIRNTTLVLEVRENEIIEKYLAELLTYKPVQYVLNEAWFYKRKFYVNEDVLIPRPETEELVQWIIKDANNLQKEGIKLKILDIGTGSGCIPVSLKLALPNSEIISIDVSGKALETAKKNVAEFAADIQLIKIDFLDESQWDTMSSFDLIVSNPPYIPLNEKESLDKNVTDFEPGTALFVSENDPFIFYKKIVEFSNGHLLTHGNIYVEIHENYAAEIQLLFEISGFKTEIKTDIYGRKRMVKASFI